MVNDKNTRCIAATFLTGHVQLGSGDSLTEDSFHFAVVLRFGHVDGKTV